MKCSGSCDITNVIGVGRQLGDCESDADAERRHDCEGDDVRQEEGERRPDRDELDAHAERDDELVRRDGREERPDVLHVLLQSDGQALLEGLGMGI